MDPGLRSGGGRARNKYRVYLLSTVARRWCRRRHEIRSPRLILIFIVLLRIVGRHVKHGVSTDLLLWFSSFLLQVCQRKRFVQVMLFCGADNVVMHLDPLTLVPSVEDWPTSS